MMKNSLLEIWAWIPCFHLPSLPPREYFPPIANYCELRLDDHWLESDSVVMLALSVCVVTYQQLYPQNVSLIEGKRKEQLLDLWMTVFSNLNHLS